MSEAVPLNLPPLPRPWCCPEPRCVPVHQLQGSELPLNRPTPGETFLCFGKAPEVEFSYDGADHRNDLRTCTYTALKGVVSYQENADDWRALRNAYQRALTALERREADDRLRADLAAVRDAEREAHRG